MVRHNYLLRVGVIALLAGIVAIGYGGFCDDYGLSSKSVSTGSSGIPLAPSTLTATAVSSARIDLNWLDNSGVELGFTIESRRGGGIYQVVASLPANVTYYSDTSVIDGTVYYYRVYSYNNTRKASYSDEASAGTVINPPSGLTVTIVSQSQIDLAWTDNSNAEDGYKIERKDNVSGTYTTIATIGTNSITYSDTGLIDGAVYYYRLLAYNTTGNPRTGGLTSSIYSNEASQAIPVNAPTSLGVNTASSSQINLTWIDNSNNEAGFKIERKTDLGGTYVQIDTALPGITSYADSSLAAETTYYYQVRANNDVMGDSAYSNEGSGTTLSAPTLFNVTVISASEVALTWADNSGLEDGFKIEYKIGEQGTYQQIDMVGPDITSYASSGLTDGTLYYYRVWAYNTSGGSDYTTEFTITTTINAPTNLACIAADSSRIELTWADNSQAEDGYLIENKTDPDAAYVQIDSVAANITGYSHSSLAEETTYYYRIRASNSAAGYSDYSNQVFAVTLKAPDTLSATVVSSAQIDLAWMDNSNLENGYKIERKTDSAGYQLIETLGVDMNVYTDIGLSDGIRYYYRLRAYNQSGNSAYSNEVSGITILKPPSSLNVVNESPTQARLTWTNNSVTQSNIAIERKVGAGSYSLYASIAGNGTSYLDNSLQAGNIYYYRVMVYNTFAESDYSNEASASVPINAPTNLTVKVTTGQFELNWNDNSANETGFKVERKEGVGGTYALISTLTPNAWKYFDTALSAEKTYYYQVKAYSDTVGDSNYSNVVSAASMPAAPTGLSATAIAASKIAINWTDNSGMETGFKVERKLGETGAYAQITTLSVNTTAYTDTGLAPVSTYYYRVRAYNTTGDSSYAAEISATTTAPGWLQVSVGSSHTVAIRSDNTLWTWGVDTTWYYRLGLGDGISRNIPTQIGTASDWLAVSVGSNHTLAIKSNGTLWAWGYNWDGQLGVGSSAYYGVYYKASPTQVGTANNWVAVAAGSNHTLAIKSNGTLWAWGVGTSGQLGVGYVPTSWPPPVTSPTQIGSDTNWSAVYAGGSHSLARKSNNTLWAWGNNGSGQLGLGDTTMRTSPVQIGSASDWLAVAAGSSHTLAVKSNNTLWAWGENGNYELGLGDLADKSSPTQIDSDTNWASAAAGSNHSFARKSNNTLWAWGYNSYGQLALGTTSSQSTPIQAGTDSDWAIISGGGNRSAGIKSNGTIWAWGGSWTGVGDSSQRNTPAQIGVPPTAPSSLSATVVSATQINLAWTDNVNNETGFKIERKLGESGTYAEIATASLNATAYNNTGLSEGTYYYRIRATNGIGDSAYSNEASATTSPNAPSGLAGSAISDSQITINWADNSSLETGFKIERATTPPTYTEITTIGPNTATSPYAGNDVIDRYSYDAGSTTIMDRTNSFSGAGNVTAFQIYAEYYTGGQVKLKIFRDAGVNWSLVGESASFTVSATGVQTYSVSPAIAVQAGDYVGLSIGSSLCYLSYSNGGSHSYITGEVTGTTVKTTWTNGTQIISLKAICGSCTYTDSGLADSTTYYYRVRSYKDTANSAYSNEASAITPLKPPTSLGLTVVDSNRIDLAWTDNSANESGYKIERSPDNVTYDQIAVTAASAVAYSDTTVIGETTYYYRVRAYNGSLNSAYSNAPSDITPLKAPTALVITRTLPTTVDISWTDNTGLEDEFRIERKDGTTGTFSQIVTTTANAASYTDTVTNTDQVYFYRVRAYDADTGTNSAYTGEVSAVFINAPTGLLVTAIDSNQIALTWTDNSGIEQGFRIYRSPDGTTFSQIALVSANVISYTNIGLTGETIYYYYVRAYYSATNSNDSNTASAATKLNAPSSLIATSQGANTIALAWTNNTTIATGIEVQRKTGAGGTYDIINTVAANDTAYTDDTGTLGTTYYYRLRAVNAGGYSSYSNEAFATTAAVSLADALDNALTWSTGGNANWFGQTTTTYDSVDAARSGAIDHSQNTYIQTTISGQGTLKFWWKVSSESGFDYLKLFEGTAEITSISGEAGWVQYTYIKSNAASKTYRWEYSKDSMISSGSDCGWLDNVEWIPD